MGVGGGGGGGVKSLTPSEFLKWADPSRIWTHPLLQTCLPALVAQLDVSPTGDQEVAGSTHA